MILQQFFLNRWCCWPPEPGPLGTDISRFAMKITRAVNKLPVC
jgi:hypothetical protein